MAYVTKKELIDKVKPLVTDLARQREELESLLDEISSTLDKIEEAIEEAEED
ncbi:hypothetical protein J7J35_02470 [Candidatus Bipolaricaulota bacterium]|nr:hypothetical protein [Candidatus Bipolaricaulota bacterium]